MPHALLLSPDDQAVSAITRVLDELSVTCERPLDGTSAAQKLNSQIFDLVLVDCENLPAAKLIFDVCRRGKNGHNPVPIAIVDGRAGLPTAFRLGAELILTKPVAKDQARSTIRTAVGRVRKDVVASEPAAAPPPSPLPNPAIAQQHSVAQQHSGAVPRAAVAAAGISSSSSSPNALTAVQEVATPPANPKSNPHPSSEPSATNSVAANTKFDLPEELSDDPVLAELDRAELEEAAQIESAKLEATTLETAKPAATKPGAKATSADREESAATSTAPVFSYSHGRQKPRGALVALLILAIAVAGFSAAWTYQPGFRAAFQTTVQPQIDRVLSLVGTVLPPASSPAPAKPVASTPPPAVPAVAPVSPAVANSTPQTNADSTTDSPSSSADATSAPATPAPTPISAAAASARPVGPGASVASPVAAPVNSTAAANKSGKPSNTTNTAAATSPDTLLPGESSAIILSSKGAEKRLAHSVTPKYPAAARPSGAEGTVVLKEVVDENGKVAGVRLVEGDAELANAAMLAVKQWRYRPYVRDGKVEPFQTVVILDFQRP